MDSNKLANTVLIVFLVLVAGAPALPADPQPIQVDREERVEVQLVQLNFLARDSRGRPVVDLDKDEIQITDNGEKQEVAILESYYGARAAAAARVAEAAQASGETAPAPAGPGHPVDAAVSPGRWIVLFFDNYEPTTDMSRYEAEVVCPLNGAEDIRNTCERCRRCFNGDAVRHARKVNEAPA